LTRREGLQNSFLSFPNYIWSFKFYGKLANKFRHDESLPHFILRSAVGFSTSSDAGTHPLSEAIQIFLFVFNRLLKSSLPVILALCPLTALADMALLMKEENGGYFSNYLFRKMSCRIEPSRVTKITNVDFFSRNEIFEIQLEDQDNY